MLLEMHLHDSPSVCLCYSVIPVGQGTLRLMSALCPQRAGIFGAFTATFLSEPYRDGNLP